MKPKLYFGKKRYSGIFDQCQIEHVEREEDSDYQVYISQFPIEKDPSTVILIQKESPLTGNRRWTYDNFDLFHLVVTHYPMGKNQIKFTDYPAVFPWNSVRSPDVQRTNTTITDRVIFYAGKKCDGYASVPDKWHTSTLYDTRSYLADALVNCDQFVVYGKGLAGAITGHAAQAIYKQVEFNDKFYQLKLRDINDCNADFILTMENCIQHNLIADKIHDAAASDRVILYLGEPNIEQHVPSECFVDLRPIFDKKTKHIDPDGLLEITQNMTQVEYDKYINATRTWRKTLVGRWNEERTKLTQRMIQRL